MAPADMVSPRNLLVPIYTVGVLGAFLQVAGGNWDVSWHALGRVDSFFAVNHIPLYAGVGLTLLAALAGLVLRLRVRVGNAIDRKLYTGLQLALAGGLIQAIAGGFDGWWHSNFGFDPFLFTPSHSLLIIGIVLSGLGMAIGSVRILRAYRANPGLLGAWASPRWLQALVVVALTSLWLVLNAVVYLLADVDGIEYTFQLGQAFVSQTTVPAVIIAVLALSVTGTLVFFNAKTILGWRGALSTIAVVSVAISTTTNLGFRGLVTTNPSEGARLLGFVPLYLAFLIPVVLFDFLVKNPESQRARLLGAALIGPFASYLDGWYGLALWTQLPFLVPWLVGPMVLAGLLGGVARTRLTTVLTAERLATLPGAR